MEKYCYLIWIGSIFDRIYCIAQMRSKMTKETNFRLPFEYLSTTTTKTVTNDFWLRVNGRSTTAQAHRFHA